MTPSINILMVAAENDALQGGKVGGIGDVVRDVPPALAQSPEISQVSIVVPSYGFLHQHKDAASFARFAFAFAGAHQNAELYEVPGKKPHPKVRHVVLHHPHFTYLDPVSQKHRIYCDDPSDRPFATDATKFAMFCAAVAAGLKETVFGKVSCLHLHDWHSAFLLLLRHFDESHEDLQMLPTAYTIHNLALQGIRPIRGNHSSVEAWYPHLRFDPAAIADPRYKDGGGEPKCVNPMAVGIRFSDAVHVVSPAYAEEILRPSDLKAGYYGGEGLEDDLVTAKKDGKLFGVLNGCEYSNERIMPRRDHAAYKEMLSILHRSVLTWAENKATEFHALALNRLEELQKWPKRPSVILTCVTRVVDQKVLLMCGSKKEQGFDPEITPALERVLKKFRHEDTICILLGTGDLGYECLLYELSNRFSQFVFLNGYSDACAASLYANGDFFLMPSSFEPCGISQMLAMRDGQPCIVHHIGGLKNTVNYDGTALNGFHFGGDSLSEKADQFTKTILAAVRMKNEMPNAYRQMCDAAFRERFEWTNSARKYVEHLYR